MPAAQTAEKAKHFITMTKTQFVQIMIVGALVGAGAWVLSWLLDVYVYQAILCRVSEDSCLASPGYALVTANILTSIVGLLAMVRLQVFRPLLVVLAVVVSLWSLPLVLGALAWYFAVLASAVIGALAYIAFSWLVRVRSFAMALILTIIAIVVVRLIMYS